MQIIFILLTALASLISVPIGDAGFRFTLGIIIFITATHIFKPKRPILMAILAGLAVCIVRIIFDSMSIDMNAALASNYLLEAFFYIGYGLIYHWAVTTNTSDYPLPLVGALVLSDAGGNALEYFLRHLANYEVYQNASLLSILIAAAIRSVIIVILIWVIQDVFKYPKKMDA